MSGYRQHSYDPYAYEQPGKPLRPYNMVQWMGVAFIVLGLAGYAAFFATEFGWLDLGFDNASGMFVFPLVGLSLINSRREPGTPAGSEQLAKNRKVLLITVAVLAVIGGALLAIEFAGA